MFNAEQKHNGQNSLWRRLFKINAPDAASRIASTADLADPTSRPQPVESLEARQIINWGLFILALFFGGGGLWVSLAKVSGAVVFQGVVKVAAERKTVQHLEGGIIKEIVVANGDHVVANQPLVILESSRISASVDQLQAQIYSQLAISARLEAEKGLAEVIALPDALKNPQGQFVNADVEAEVAAQAKIFSSRRKALQGQEDLIRSQIAQVGEQIASIDERIKAEGTIISALQEELSAKEALYQDRFIDKSLILQIKRSKAEHEGLRGQFLGAIAENREKIAALRLQIVTLHDKYIEEANARQAESGAMLLDLRERLRPLNDARQRLVITAPISGEIVALNVHSVGGVLGAGQPILDIVPENSHLVVEGKIMLRDITKVAVGQKAEVQLLAFETSTNPKIPGTVRYISADRIIEHLAVGPQSSYQVEIDLDKTALSRTGLYLSPGMPAAVYVLTKERTVLEYALEPLMQNFDMALREN